MRTKRWKYIRYTSANPSVEELYDLKHDPLEEHNLAGSARGEQELKRLRARWEQFRAELKEPTMRR